MVTKPVDFWTPRGLDFLRVSGGHHYIGGMFTEHNGDSSVIDHPSYLEWTSAIGKRPAIIAFDNDAWRTGGRVVFPREQIERADSLGAVPFIHLNLTSVRGLKKQRDPHYSLLGIINGQFDQELSDWAKAAAAWRKPILIQWGAECNGATFWWTPNVSGGPSDTEEGAKAQERAAEQFKKAYQHIVRVFRRNGATNVRFVFHAEGPNSKYGDSKFSKIELLFPGSVFCPVVGTSFYKKKERPSALDDILELTTVRYQLAAVAPSAGFMICEIGAPTGPHFPTDFPTGKWWGDVFPSLYAWDAVCSYGGSYGPDVATPEGSYRIYDDPGAVAVWSRHIRSKIGGRESWLGA